MRSLVSVLPLAASLLLPAAADAASRSAALGADGTVYRAVVGPHRFLFPGAPGSLARNSVIALEVEAPGSAMWRTAVPASLGDDVEGEVALFSAPGGASLILVWEARSGFISRLLLSSWQPDGGWSEPLEVPSSPFATKRGLAVAMTRDQVAGAEGGLLSRQLVHLAWCEGDVGRSRCRYAAAVGVGEEPFAVALDSELDPLFGDLVVLGEDRGGIVPTLAAGGSPDRLLAAFPLSAAGALATVELRVAPTELRRIADSVAEQLARQLAAGGSPGALAGDVRAHIIMMGSETFRAGVLAEIGDSLAATLLRWAAAPQIDAEALVDEVRAHIIMMGVEALAGPLTRDAGEVLGVVVGRSGAPEADLLVGVTGRSVRSLPDVGANAELLLSQTGRGAIVSWSEGRFLRYRESSGAQWSEVRSLTIGDSLDLQAARALLGQRAAELD